MELSNIISNVMQIPKAKIGNISVLKKRNDKPVFFIFL